jgi:hypothetical protein
VFFDGKNSKVQLARGITNCLFDCGASNTLQSFVNLTIDGQEPSNYTAVASIAVPYNQDEVPGHSPSSIVNRNGIRINTGGGGIIHNCQFCGWS